MITWSIPKLVTNAASFKKQENDYDIVILAEPMIRTLDVPKHDPLGKKVVHENKKVVYETKKVHYFILSTVGLLKTLKSRAAINNKIMAQIDGAQGLTKDGWVLSSLTPLFNRFDKSRHRYVRSPFTPIWKLHYSECHDGHACFLKHFKTLPKTHFEMNVEFDLVMECQDRADYIQTAVKEVHPNCEVGTCSVHIERKFDDGTIGRRLSKTSNMHVMKVHIHFLIQCETQKMMNYCSKVFLNLWKYGLNELTWASSFEKYYISDKCWHGRWCFAVMGFPVMTTETNAIESVHHHQQKQMLRNIDKKCQ